MKNELSNASTKLESLVKASRVVHTKKKAYKQKFCDIENITSELKEQLAESQNEATKHQKDAEYARKNEKEVLSNQEKLQEDLDSCKADLAQSEKKIQELKT